MGFTLASLIQAIAHLTLAPFLVLPALLAGFLWTKTRK
jgi:hypothetical protein